MPVHEIQGNLLECDSYNIAHGCNCFNTMGSGVARALRARWPEVYEADCRTKRGDKAKLGTLSFATVKDDRGRTRMIYNLYTQYRYGRDKRHADYDAIRAAMEALRNSTYLSRLQGMTIAIPRIGCGLAGGDWGIVKPIIEEVFPNDPILMYYL